MLGQQWFTQPAVPLSGRSYSAWPLFENAYQSVDDVYGRIEAMVENPGSSVAATLAVGQLDGRIFRRDWSSRTLRSESLRSPWEFDWPTPTASFGPHDNIFSLGGRGVGAYNIIGAPKFAQLQLGVTMTPDVGLVRVTPDGGPLTTHTALGTRSVGEGATGTFCFAPDGCECPQGSSSGAIPMAGPDMIFSHAAAAHATVSAVRAEEWDPDQHCQTDPDVDRAWSNGDPHLVTFDGLPFDVVTLGEFVTARDPFGDFEVQARHEPIGAGAGTTAVALSTGDHRITITMPDLGSFDDPVIRVDGIAATDDDLTIGDVTLVSDEFEVVVTWPDGSRVELRWFQGWFVEIVVPTERSARMEGLLGSADGDLGNDLGSRDGTVIDTTDMEQYESDAALAWSVGERTTLFDYEPGQSVATFRIPHPDPEPVEVPEDVRDDCADALGAAATDHEVASCAFDVAATGDSALSTST